MKTGKRILCILLIFALFISLVPTAALAQSPEQSTIDNSDMTVKGTNGFGTLMSKAITEEQNASDEEADTFDGGYSVTALSIEGNQATITYDTLEEATAVVAIYTEDGIQLLTSGTATVSPEETEAVITIEGNMPQYFYTSAYLLDTYDMSPLCAAYDTPMYTQEMQELLASTVEDYDQDRVLNLDEDNTTNFAVYADNTIVVPEQEGVNTVVAANDETATYVIENADETITGLQPGDVFAYPYGENEILIVKVASITLDGTTATIQGDELDMEEAFSQVKVEGESGTKDVVVDGSTAAEGITYEGVVAEDSPRARSVGGGSSVNSAHEFKIAYTEKTESGAFEGSCSINGSLKFQINVNINFFISIKNQYLEFKATPTATSSITIKGNVAVKLPLGTFGVSPIPGVYVGFEPKMEVKFTGNITFRATLTATIGIKFDTSSGVQNLSTSPKFDVDVDLQGTLFFGIDMSPKVTIVGDKVAKLSLSATIGLKMTGTMSLIGSGIDKQDSPSRHACKRCLGVKYDFEAKLSGSVSFLNMKKLTFPFDIAKITIPLGESYNSYDWDEFGWGPCPHTEYRVTLLVKDRLGNPVQNAETVTNSGESWGKTNSYGVAVQYVPAGTYTITTTINGEPVKNTVTITAAAKITIVPDKKASISSTPGKNLDTSEYLKYLDRTTEVDIVDNGAVIDSGTCGKNVNWIVYADGLLKISGSGAMEEYIYWGSLAPWKKNCKDNITRVVIEDGVTSIGGWAFEGCSKLMSISIPDSVTGIGEYAFSGCSSLADIAIPNGVTWIQYKIFGGCTRLTSITIPSSVTIIEHDAFSGCVDLKNVYYTGTEAQWNEISVGTGNSRLTSATIHYYNSTGPEDAMDKDNSVQTVDIFLSGSAVPEETLIPENEPTSENIPQEEPTLVDIPENETLQEDIPPENVSEPMEEQASDQNAIAPQSIFGGEYDTEQTETGTYKTATFSGLVPGEQYVMLAMVSIEVDNPLAPDNLLFIDQAQALEDGTVSFRYVQRVQADLSYVVACGPSNKNLKDAEITFPEMKADNELHPVNPTVVYDGKALEEGLDYVLLGDVSYTEPGDYTCRIRGIRAYAGLVSLSYSVAPGAQTFTISASSAMQGNNGSAAPGGVSLSAATVKEGDSVTATAKAAAGFDFVGWFAAAAQGTAYTGTPLSKDLSFTFTPTVDTQLVAVYKTKPEEVSITVYGTNFTITVDGKTSAVQRTKAVQKVPVGTVVTVTCTDDSFVNWQSEYGMILSKQPSYTFTVLAAGTYASVNQDTVQGAGLVEFVSSYNQVMSCFTYLADDEVEFPAGPVKIGFVFDGWDKTEAEIQNLIASGEKHIVVSPKYHRDMSIVYDLTVYVDGVQSSELSKTGVAYARSFELEAPAAAGKQFKCWATDAAGKNVLGYASTCFVKMLDNMTVYAIYANEGETIDRAPTISITPMTAVDGQQKITTTIIRNVPEGYTMVEHGVLVNRDGSIQNPTSDSFVIGGANIIKAQVTNDAVVGADTPTVTISNDHLNTTVFLRGYLVVQNQAGEREYYYTDIVSGSINDLRNNL